VWWDTEKNTQHEINLPARTLDVLPSTGGIAISTTPPGPNSISSEPPVGPSSSPAPENSGTNYRWNWISLVFALLWLGTLAAWWYSNRRSPKNLPNQNSPTTPAVSAPRIAEARKAFQQACRENNAQAARRHLLGWAQAAWSQDPPFGLKNLAERLADKKLKPLLNQLDRACYTDGVWDGAALQELKELKERDGQLAPSGLKLAGLYS
jgi:hypothetical protein